MTAWYSDDDSPEQIAADLEAARLAQMRQERDAMTPEQRLEVAAFLLEGMQPTQAPGEAPSETPRRTDEKAVSSPEHPHAGGRWASADDAALKRASRAGHEDAFAELLGRRIRGAEQAAS
jgi:hypothetical protein